MKKIIIALLYSVVSIAQAELVKDKSGNTVNDINLDILLETAPIEAQKKLLKNKRQIMSQLEQLYLRDILAKMAVKEGLDKEGINAERLLTIRNNSLYLLKLEALRRSNTRDYTKYAKQVYQSKKQDYAIAEKIDAAHILITTKTLSDIAALEKSQKIRQQLMLGARFSELALKESEDKSVQQNLGELGTFSHTDMVKAFSDVAFSMESGDISEPVKTQYGYHIIKLNKKIPAGFKSFEQVKIGIINKLMEKDWKIAREKFLGDTAKENQMQIDEQALDVFITRKLRELEGK